MNVGKKIVPQTNFNPIQPCYCSVWLLLYYYIFQWDFAANNLKTHGRNSLGHIHRGNPKYYGESKLLLIVSGPPRDEVLPLMMGILNLFFLLFFPVTKRFPGDHVSSFLPGHRCSLHLLTSSPAPSHCCPVTAAP